MKNLFEKIKLYLDSRIGVMIITFSLFIGTKVCGKEKMKTSYEKLDAILTFIHYGLTPNTILDEKYTYEPTHLTALYFYKKLDRLRIKYVGESYEDAYDVVRLNE